MSSSPGVRGISRRFEFPVERGKILEFARAMQSDNPSFSGPDALAPPTFLIVASQIWGDSWERPGDSPLAAAGVDATQALHLRETYEFFGAPLAAGERLEGELVLFDPVEKVGRRSGAMTLHETETTYWRADGSRAATARQLIAQLHAAHRSEAPAETAGGGDPGAGWEEGWTVAQFGPVSLEDVVAYQAASGDLNPHHYDAEVLHAAGFTRFFTPGMFAAGLLGGILVDVHGAAHVRRISVAFHELVYVGDVVSAGISPPSGEGEGGLREVSLECRRGDGAVALSGLASVAVDG